MADFIERMKGMIDSAVEVLQFGADQRLLMSHFDRVLNMLLRWPKEVDQSTEDPSTLADAIEVLQGLAVYLLPSRNRFRPLALQAMGFCLLGLGNGICQVRVCTYELIVTLADVLESEMSRVYPIVHEQMKRDILNRNCTYLERSVIDTLRFFAKNSGNAIKDHLGNGFQLTGMSMFNTDEGIRIASIKALCSFVVAFRDLDCPIQAQRAYKSLVPTFASILRRDSRVSVVSELSSALSEVFSESTPTHWLSDREVADPIFECIRDMIAKRTACQQTETGDACEICMSGANMLACYGEALDPALYALYFGELYGSIVQIRIDTPAESLFEFYGMLSDCIEPLGCRAVPYHDFLLSVLLIGCEEPDPNTRQNAYYGIGNLVSQVGQTAVKSYPEILTAFFKACDREQPGSARDTLSGTLARMIITNLNAVPLDQVLPRFMSCLPVTTDFYENEHVIEAFWMMYEGAHDRVTDYVEQMLLISSRILLEEQVDDPVDGENLIREIMQTYPQIVDKVSGENPDVDVYLKSILDSSEEDQVEN